MSLGSEYISESYAHELEQRDRIKREAAQGVWVTYDGRHIPVREMTRDHIEKTMGYIRRTDKTDMMLPWLITFRNELIRRYGI